MANDITGIHHIGLVVRDMEAALAAYRRLGFRLGPPAYPALPPAPGAAPGPVGAGNTHADFPRSFIELLAPAPERQELLPEGARLTPLRVPDGQLAATRAVITRTVANLVQRLQIAEGAHILVFATRDADATAARLDAHGIGHSGARSAQRPIATAGGVVPADIRFLDVDGPDSPPGMAPEGRVGAAEDAPPELLDAQVGLRHPNGATGVAEVVVCVGDDQIRATADRYERLLDRSAVFQGRDAVVDLGGSRVTVTDADGLAARLPGERPHTVPGLSACAIAVADPAAAEEHLRARGVMVGRTAEGEPFVPAREALGTALMLRQAD
ncbi:VOC family protein [Glycomyces sp. A-F 0318]|uniref:VOC family protein n=1 Tax=Glycomyces amatae TaxID=2881355 RepID=UPI001E64032A|nr:VOC family protein [Glycomyces amatae]MCD0446974.1 VOC family protein [Glycomyces amatae]